MCFVIFVVLGAFGIALWQHDHPYYALGTLTVSAVFLFFSVRKIIRNGRCLFGKRKDC
jgi:arginine exporter protein ArgO